MNDIFNVRLHVYLGTISTLCLVVLVYLVSVAVSAYQDHNDDIKQIRDATEHISKWIHHHQQNETKYRTQAESFIHQMERLKHTQAP